jgi:hypothetical protein
VSAVNAPDPRQDTPRPLRRAGPLQVAKTVFFGLFAIGMKGTWEKEGVQVTPGQIVVAALIGGVLLVAVLITVVRVVLKLATG